MATIFASNGKPLTAEQGGGIDARLPHAAIAVHANRAAIGPWEQWARFPQPARSQVVWKTSGGFYLTAELEGTLSTRATSVGPWECFWEVPVPGGYAYRSEHGKYLCAELGTSDVPVTCNRDAVGPWETFSIPDLIQLPRLTAVGAFFQQDGQPFTLIETSDFYLFARYAQGEDITPVLAQRRAIGFNAVRVFSQMDITLSNGERLIFTDPHYDRWPAFLALLAQYGLYADVVAYTGPYTWGFTPMHWTQLGEAVRHSANVILSLVNENGQPNNHIDVTPFQPFPDVPCSRGTDVPPSAGWTWTELHSNGQFEWWRKVGHNTMELAAIYHIAGHGNENQRYPDTEQSLTRAYDAAAGAALLTGGSTFHSVNGRNSTLFLGLELDAAKQWVAGARSVPVACQPGGYRHRQDLEGSTYLRVYQRGTDDACIVRIRK